MIADSLSNTARYRGLGPRFDAAFDFLAEASAQTENGRHDIADGVFANVMEYTPQAAEDKQFEAHERYVDVQVVFSGSECILAGNIDAAAYDYGDDDCVLLDLGGLADTIHMDEGSFCILWPGEAHKPGIAVEDYQGTVKKIVVKVAVDEL